MKYSNLKCLLLNDPKNNQDEITNFENLVKENGTIFFDKSEKVHHVLLVSFPRCGNTFTRKIFENITGVTTGSDFNTDNCPTMALTILGFKGESVQDDRIWLLKTHYPMSGPLSKPCIGG